jgi:hypothetical protein
MLLKLFRSNRSLVILVLPMIIAAIWLPAIQKQNIRLFPFEQYPGLFYKALMIFAAKRILASKILALLLFLLISILLVRLNTKYFFIPIRTQMPAVIYMLIVSSVVVLQRFNPVIISSLILILAIDRIFGSYKYEGLAYHYFDSALLISLSSLIYINSFFFISFTWIGLILLRTFNWREWSFTIIGFLLPYLFLWGYFYATDRSMDELLFAAIRKNFETGFQLNNKITDIKIITIVLMVYMIHTSLFMVQRFDSKKTYARKYLMFFLWMFIISTIFFVLLPSFGIEYVLIAAIPLTYLFSHYFIFTKINWINRIMFGVFFLIPFYLAYSDKIYDWIKK